MSASYHTKEGRAKVANCMRNYLMTYFWLTVHRLNHMYDNRRALGMVQVCLHRIIYLDCWVTGSRGGMWWYSPPSWLTLRTVRLVIFHYKTTSLQVKTNQTPHNNSQGKKRPSHIQDQPPACSQFSTSNTTGSCSLIWILPLRLKTKWWF